MPKTNASTASLWRPQGVLTVQFTVRGNVIRLIGAGYWRNGKQIHEAQTTI